jgi:transposase-like protein
MAEKRKTYTAEFKREAVRLVTERRYGVAERPGIWGSIPMLRRWKRESADHANGIFPGRYAFMVEQQQQWPVSVLCEMIEVSRSGFYTYMHWQRLHERMLWRMPSWRG